MNMRSPIEGRLDFFELHAANRTEFPEIARLIDRHGPDALAKFYDKVAATPEAARFFSSREMMNHASDKQMQHWGFMFRSTLDDAYYGRAETIGKVHARIGLDASLYFGAYAQILGTVIEKAVAGSICGWIPGVRRLARRISTLIKVALLDMDIAVTTIFRTREDTQHEVIEQVGQGLQAMAQGDLCVTLPALPRDYQQLGDDFACATAGLRDMISTVSRSFVSIHTGANEISTASNDLAHRTERQAAALEETAAALRELAGSVRQTAQDADGARDTAHSANSDAQAGGSIVARAVTAMNQINHSSSEIGAIVDVIDSIAFQTNLLALNAGIEAARAGHAGQGFAVVANEVRALAQRSAQAAQDIKQLIGQSSGQVEAGVSLVGDTGRALEQIVERSGAVSCLVDAIASKAEGQANSIQEVNVAVAQMDQMTQQNAAMVEQSTAAAASLAEQAAKVSAVVSRFRVDAPAQGGWRASA